MTLWSFHSEKSLLWIYGGHPALPSSADLYHKQQQLCRLCECLWPLKLKSHDRGKGLGFPDPLSFTVKVHLASFSTFKIRKTLYLGFT